MNKRKSFIKVVLLVLLSLMTGYICAERPEVSLRNIECFDNTLKTGDFKGVKDSCDSKSSVDYRYELPPIGEIPEPILAADAMSGSQISCSVDSIELQERLEDFLQKVMRIGVRIQIQDRSRQIGLNIPEEKWGYLEIKNTKRESSLQFSYFQKNTTVPEWKYTVSQRNVLI